MNLTLNPENLVTLNLFQGPFLRAPSFLLSRTEQATGGVAHYLRKLGEAARWVLKQVQDDEKGKWGA